ncbi:MAG: hypothetical protein FJ267_01685, partial [Planctomycetes bacterium]|nr:hypothetical protein [Planctomycetota bacterium]
MASDSSLAWLSRGKLFVKQRDNSVREIESDFAKNALLRNIRDAELDGWKERSGIWGNFGIQPPGVAPWQEAERKRQIRYSTIARGATENELFYVLDMGNVGGLFRYDL